MSRPLALNMGARLEDVALTIHAHPAMSEAFDESALAGARPSAACVGRDFVQEVAVTKY